MTAATDTASPPGPAVGDAADYLRSLPAILGLRDETYVRSTLSTVHATGADLSARIEDGTLVTLVVDGVRWFAPTQVRALLLTAIEDLASTTAAQLEPARTALTDYLQQTSATGDYTEARAELRPLVCARTGKTWVNTGLQFHAVVLPILGVSELAKGHDDPAVRALPGAGASLLDLLCALPGVTVQYGVTPLHGDHRSRRVRNWVRVDSTQWSVSVPSVILAELERVR